MAINNLNQNFIRPHVSTLIDTFVPEHVRSRNPQFIKFIQAYLEFLETTHGSAYIQNTLPQQRDIDLQEEQFLRSIEQEIGLFVPREYASTPRVFYNKISQLWRAKGSEESIKTFFRLFLDDPIEVRYPWDKVLKPSDGRWLIDNKLRVSVISGNPEDLLGKQIRQIEELGVGKIERVERRVYSQEIVYELVLVREEIVGTFKVGNTIQTTDGSVAAEIYNSVVKLNIINGGSGYKLGDRVTLLNQEGNTFTAFVNLVNESGSILSTTIADFGAGTTPNHILDNQNNFNRPFYLEEFVLFVYSTRTVATGQEPIFSVKTKEGEGAEFSIEYGPIAVTDGVYSGVKGQLSSSIVLQDSKFYQKFSYEVITQTPINSWREPLRKTVHPAGTEVFANLRFFDLLKIESKALLNSEFVAPPSYALGERVSVGETAIGWEDTYATDYTFDDYAGVLLFDRQFTNTSVPPVADETNTL